MPQETIARILYDVAFEDSMTRVEAPVIEALTNYVEIFVQEAAWRSKECARIRSGASSEDNEITVTHKDLEQVAGMLLLDM